MIVNGENAANGRGITPAHCREFHALGVDCITSGNHIWDQAETLPYIQRNKTLLRPANFPPNFPGKGFYLHELADERKLAVVNLMGSRYMQPLDDPFIVMSGILDLVKAQYNCRNVFVDFHAEAAGEKMAFAHCFDGQISAVVGTHTHVPTADARILPGGTAFMTDVGMSGDYDSIIGIQKACYLRHLGTNLRQQELIPATAHMTLCGALVTLDDLTGLAINIQPLRLGDSLVPAMPDTTLPQPSNSCKHGSHWQ